MFRKRKSKPNGQGAVGQFTDKAAGKIAAAIIYTQNRFAIGMNKSTRRFSPATWKVLIVVSVISWGTLSVDCILNAFKNPPEMTRNKTIHFIAMPKQHDSLALMEAIYQQQRKKLHK